MKTSRQSLTGSIREPRTTDLEVFSRVGGPGAIIAPGPFSSLILHPLLAIFVYIICYTHPMVEENPILIVSRRLTSLRPSKASLIQLSIAIGLILAVAWMFPRGETMEFEYKIGGIWAQKDLIAPFSFPILRDEKEYANDVRSAKSEVYEVFARDTLAESRQSVIMEKFFAGVDRALGGLALYQRSARIHAPSLPVDSSVFQQLSSSLDMTFSEREWSLLAGLKSSGRLTGMRRVLGEITRQYLRTGILDRNKNMLGHTEVAIRVGTVEEIVPVSRLYDINDVVTLLEQQLVERLGEGRSDVGIAYKIGITHLTPNLVFDSAATSLALAAAVDAVPRTSGFIQENERVVSKHERIAAETKLKLDSFQRARADRGPTSDAPSQVMGTVLHVAIVVMLYGIYLYLFRKKIITSPRRLSLIALLVLLVCVVAYVTREVDVSAPIEYLIVVPAASMLLTILFDSRVGFYGTVIMAVLVAGIRGNDYSLALASLVGGALSVYTVRDMKNRTQIFRSLGFIFLGYALSIIALGLERFESAGVIAEQLSFALANAIISPVLSYGLLVFLEKSFKVTTDLTLLELAQFNHPLLRLLAEKAPGTYHHSLNMATLAEAGAAAVGANVVLARVGAYFHDIGKIIKPTYFVENQRTVRSRHDKLAPRMSSLIIATHVKDGIALAREYNLPEEVIDFIPMHHGTTRIDFFYKRALDLAKNSDDETKIDEIKEQDYRYPGPKPNTKETGVMMLADAIEAAVRTIEEPTPQRIEDLVNEIVKRRLEEGELDECPLTMGDLTAIKIAFRNVLVGIYHSRVKYPEPEKRRARGLPRPAGSVPTAPESPPPVPRTEGDGAA